MIKDMAVGFGASAAIALTGQAVSAEGRGEITVGYFLEWPMPFQVAKVQGDYDKALGKKVNWVSFESGVAMSVAMASGDVQIALSQGLPPFVIAASGGQDIQVVDVAVSYSENDSCVVADRLEIDKFSVSELAGKTVAVPLGTAAHYGFLQQMAHFGVDVTSMSIVDMAPAEGAAALSQGSVDMACGWGGALRRMLDSGNVLLSGTEKEVLGILVFDVTSAPASFVAENGDDLARFLAVTAAANSVWSEGSHAEDMLTVIAEDSGMDLRATRATMGTFHFPSIEEQLSEKWLGGGVQRFMEGMAQVFVNSGAIDGTLPDYSITVNTGPLTAASKM